MTFSLVLLLAALASDPPAPAPPPAPQPYTELVASDLLDFRYSFPTLVGSDPVLLAEIRGDERAMHSAALATARDDSNARRDQHFPFHAHVFWRDWTIDGQSDRLMTLRSQTEMFTGGAHGMHVTGVKLWDQQRHAKIAFASLFSSPSRYWPLLETDFCRKLAAERLRRIGMKDGRCPAAKELVLIPADTNSDWRFDTIRIVADPYVAGAYAEGRYEIPLAVTASLIAALRPAYRASFEVQRQ